MSLAIGDVIAQIGGAPLVREHTALNITVGSSAVSVGEVIIPAGHVLAVEVTTAETVTLMIKVSDLGRTWGETHMAGEMAGSNRATAMTALGHAGTSAISVMSPGQSATVTGLTTTLIPT